MGERPGSARGRGRDLFPGRTFRIYPSRYPEIRPAEAEEGVPGSFPAYRLSSSSEEEEALPTTTVTV
jgi:hypothetical protein